MHFSVEDQGCVSASQPLPRTLQGQAPVTVVESRLLPHLSTPIAASVEAMQLATLGEYDNRKDKEKQRSPGRFREITLVHLGHHFVISRNT